jgi:N-acetylneuraminate synthase
VSIKNILKGEKLDHKNIWVKRPGTGFFLAKDYEKLIGKIAKNNICTNTQIKRSDVIN